MVRLNRRVVSLTDTYDGVTAAGCFSPGHVPCAALHELIRIVKPGMIQRKDDWEIIRAEHILLKHTVTVPCHIEST